MKTSLPRLVLLPALLLLAASSGRADDAAYAAILKERDSVLVQIVDDRKSRLATGMVDENAVIAAQVALYSFRRDTAATDADRIGNQEKIVAVHEQKLAQLQVRIRTGVASSQESLEARATLLEAKQRLEELHRAAKKS